MCGLLGYSGKNNYNKDLIKILFILNQDRGYHSSGYFNNNKKIKWEDRVFKKTGGVINQVLTNHDFKESNLFIGHTRHATVGTVCIENTHPFMYGDVVGAHNGTLRNLDMLLKTYNNMYPNNAFNNYTIDVDSKIFPYYINTIGNLKILSDYEGACALMWHVKDTNILNIYKDEERPLHYGIITQNNEPSIYISSEKEPLKIIGCTKIEEFKSFIHYQIKDGVILNKSNVKIKRNPLIKKKVKITKNNQFLLWVNNNVGLTRYSKIDNITNVYNYKGRITMTSKYGACSVFNFSTFSTRVWKEDRIIYNETHSVYQLLRTYNDNTNDIFLIDNIEKLMELFHNETNNVDDDDPYEVCEKITTDIKKELHNIQKVVPKKIKFKLSKVIKKVNELQNIVDYYG